MRIIFDLLCAQPIGSLKFHGGGEYTKTVFQYVVERNISEKLNLKITVCFDFDKFIDEWILKQINGLDIEKVCVKNIKDINDVVKRESAADDVRFFAGMGYNYQEGNVDFPKNVVSIGVFHGLRILEKPYDSEAWRYGTLKRRIHDFLDWVLFKDKNIRNEENRQRNAIINFDSVVTVSHHSAYSLKVNFGATLENKDIHVFYSPLKFVPEMDAPIENSESGNYIMIVSADRWLKNSYRGLSALDDLYSKGFLKNIKTKVFGNAPDLVKHKLKNREKFEFFGYVSNSELESAYNNCLVFFYPTLNEGFGYPPLEAMKYGKTCAISAVSSLTEVYRDSVYYFNPYDKLEMENRILQAVEHPIDCRIISENVHRINDKQKEDLFKLSEIIIGSIDNRKESLD